MKNPFQMNAVFATGFLFISLLLPAALAGTAEGGGPITGGIPTPRFKTTVDIQEGYNDNVYTSHTSQVRSAFTTADLNIFANLGTGRTVLTIGAGGGLTYYYSRPGDKADKLGNFSLNLVHKVNERLTLTLSSYNTYQVQPQFDLLVQQNRTNGQYYYTTESISANYQWTGRFSTVTGYTVTGIFYELQAVKAANDYVGQTFSNQFRYLALPTTTLVAEYRFGLINYLYNPKLNSFSNYVLAGFDHSFSPEFTMTLRAGGQIQHLSVGSSTASPYAEFTANYQYQRYSSIQAFLNYGYQYSNLTVSQTNKALRIGMTVNHGFTAKLSAYLGFFYEHDDYSSAPGAVGLQQDTLNANTGLRFAVTQKLNLQAGYQHTSLISDISALEYKQNVFTLGANYTF